MTAKIPRVANSNARAYVQQRKPFRGNNTSGAYVDDHYVVYSYGEHWPLFVYDYGRWFANSDRWGTTTSKHRSQLHPLTDCTPMSLSEMCDLVNYGFLGKLTRRLVGRRHTPISRRTTSSKTWGNMTDERDNDSDRLIHPETWPCDPAALGPVFLGWDTSPGMVELLAVGAVYSVEADKVHVLQVVPRRHFSKAQQQAQDYINAARRLSGT